MKMKINKKLEGSLCPFVNSIQYRPNNFETSDCSIIYPITKSDRKYQNSKSLQIAHIKEKDENFIEDYQTLLKDLKIKPQQNLVPGLSLKVKKNHVIDESKKLWLASSAKNIFSYKNEPIRLSHNLQPSKEEKKLSETDRKSTININHKEQLPLPVLSRGITQRDGCVICSNCKISLEDSSPGQLHLRRLAKRNKSIEGQKYIGASFKTNTTKTNNLNKNTDILSPDTITLKIKGKYSSNNNVITSIQFGSIYKNQKSSLLDNILYNQDESVPALRKKIVIKRKRNTAPVYKIIPFQ